MIMSSEIGRVINLLQEGKISAEEAEQLISAIKNTDTEHKSSRKGFLGKILKVRVKSNGKDNVSVNIPLNIVKFALKMGHGIAWSIPEAKAYLEDIDIDVILHAIDHEIDGKIVDIETDEGDIVIIEIA